MSDIVDELKAANDPLSTKAAKEIQELRRQVTRISESHEVEEELLLFSLEYVAALLSISERAMRAMVQRGEIPYVQAGEGRFKRIRKSDLRAYVEEKYSGSK